MAARFSKRVSWRIEAWAYSFIAAVVSLLPPGGVFLFGEVVGKMIWPLMTARQKTVARNLRISGIAAETGSVAGLAKQSFIRTTANLLSSSVASKLPPERLGEILAVENPELLEEAVAPGNGVILLLAHMGNWELLTRLHRFFPDGIRCGAFYRPLNNPILNQRVVKEREADGTVLFSKRDSLHQVSGFLRENGVIGILADQRVGLQGEVVSFFGRLTRASPLPSLLARRCKSEVLSLSLRTVSPGKWSARYHRVNRPYDSENCMEALERAMMVSPMDVFWLQERWKVYVGPGVTFLRWLKKEDARGIKPHRGLVWRREEERGLPLSDECLHGDIRYEEATGRAAGDLEGIDLAKRLPLDFILVFSENSEVRAEAKRLGIPVIHATGFSG